jgi:GxxExxY protein
MPTSQTTPDDPLTRSIIGRAYAVANGLGTGFLEQVYENALANALGDAGLSVARQSRHDVVFEGRVVGTYVADIVVEDNVIVELKAVSSLHPTHTAQCINILKATGLPLCLLMNFGGKRLEVRRLYRPR